MLWRKIRRRKEWQGERKKGEKKEEREGVFYKKETREEEKEEETEKRWKKERRKERPGSWEGKKERKIKNQGQDPHTTARMPPGNQSLTLAKSLALTCPPPNSGAFQSLLPASLSHPPSYFWLQLLHLRREHSLSCLCSQGAWEAVLGRVQVMVPQKGEASPERQVISVETVSPGHPNPAEVRPHPGNGEWPPQKTPSSHQGTLLSSLLPSPLLFNSHYPSANRVELGTWSKLLVL